MFFTGKTVVSWLASRGRASLALFALLLVGACTDYVQQMEDEHDEWERRKNGYAWESYIDSNDGYSGDYSSSSEDDGYVEWTSSSSEEETVVETVDKPVSSSSSIPIEYGYLVDFRDNARYRTVAIGSQRWMAENLNYEVSGSYCYENVAVYCDLYGRLYAWSAAVGKTDAECGHGKACELPSVVQGVCPSGWRLPTKSDFDVLFETVGGEDVAGKMLKSTNGWSRNGDDVYGFAVLPAGDVGNTSYEYLGENAYIWTATEIDPYEVYRIFFTDSYDGVSYFVSYKRSKASVRCIQNEAGVTYPEDGSSSSAGESSSSLEQLVCGDMWCGLDGDSRVNTGLDAGKDESGYWFGYSDESVSGASAIVWPLSDMDGNDVAPVIEYCSGLCGTFVLGQGSNPNLPYVGVGFNVAGKDVSGDPIASNAADWGGVCVVYMSDAGIKLRMKPGKSVANLIDYDYPYVILEKSPAAVSVANYAWSDFGQDGWGSTSLSGEAAAKLLASLLFEIEGQNGDEGYFRIVSVGRYGTCE